MKSGGTSVVCTMLVLLAGCCCRPIERANQSEAQSQRAAIESRAALIFTNAVLLKPRETLSATDLASALAPLLIQEVTSANADSDCGPATIYYQLGATQIAGGTRPQVTYLWLEGNDEKRWHGVRLTLDSRGLPVIWEVLSEKPGPRVVFVSRSLETKAQIAFGPPAPGRHFSIEQPIGIAPDVVVARVIEDGPVAMGPIIHETASGEISAVICRCIPTQARKLMATHYYQLKSQSSYVDKPSHLSEAVVNLDRKLCLPPAF